LREGGAAKNGADEPKKGFSRCYSVDGRGLGEGKEDGTIQLFAGFFQKPGTIGKEKNPGNTRVAKVKTSCKTQNFAMAPNNCNW